ncbi:MAG: transposase [Roseateles sp.]|uniref:IS66-like element accessory protein TnpA n=1 Tax=Roseateles sp. TaxID=1971397 RepID=UPI0039E7C4F4
MEQASAGRRRRFHSDDFKAQAVQACGQPGVSMASVAMANGINANLLRRWVLAAAQPQAGSVMRASDPQEFIPLPMPTPAPAVAEPIRIELQRGVTTIAVSWPISAADACAAWLRELLR